MDAVSRPAAGSADRARHQMRPIVDVGLRVADHGRLAGGAARGVDARHFIHRHRHHLKGIALPKVLFCGEGEFCDVLRRLHILRAGTCLIKLAAVEWHVLIGMQQRPLQPLQLQRRDLVTRGDLYWVENVFRRCQVTHYGLVLFVFWR